VKTSFSILLLMAGRPANLTGANQTARPMTVPSNEKEEATNGQHQPNYSGERYNGAFELVTPDGRHLKCQPIGRAMMGLCRSQTIKVGIARCAVPGAERSVRRRKNGAFTTFAPSGRGRRSAASLPPEKFVKGIIPSHDNGISMIMIPPIDSPNN